MPAVVNSKLLEAHADRFRGRRVLVTGGAGFIGSHLVEALVELGAVVRVVDDFSAGDPKNLSSVAGQVEVIEGSILNRVLMQSAASGATAIFHQAALGSVPASVASPVEYVRVNVNGTQAVLESARAAGVERVVYAASSSAYGDGSELPKVESMPPDPISPYAAAKLAGEHLLRSYSACYGIGGASLRYFNVFGRRQSPDSTYAAVVPRFIDALRRGDPVTIYGDGEQTRDFTHVDNVVHANLLAADPGRAVNGDVVNVGCGERISLLDLLARIATALGVEARANHEPARVGDVRDSEAAIDRARAVLGYEPITGIDEGIGSTVASS